ncbi:unannotated protein [freshwater metagenome]|uniref:Unannotated protein n=2 Tax=root TaxID=1 RepID=A0A6J7HYJ0_9ZZZZ
MPLRILIVGGPSGSGLDRPDSLIDLADTLGITPHVTFMPPQPSARLAQVYRAADLVAVPSYNESFGLVAIEAQACGTPVLAADVGGLGVAVRSGETGRLVQGHRITDWADALASMLVDRAALSEMAIAAPLHARNFSWEHTADGLIESYRQARFHFDRGEAPSEFSPRRVRGLSKLRRSGAVTA